MASAGVITDNNMNILRNDILISWLEQTRLRRAC
jgi:hypothetical protein